MNQYTERLRSAADFIEVHGWTQGVEQSETGQVCLTGAVRLCALQNGDEYVIREILRLRNRAEEWNDREEQTQDGIVSYLKSAEIRNDLRDTFGPNWKDIVTLVRQAASLTKAEAQKINDVRSAIQIVDRMEARDAVRGAVREFIRNTAWEAARTAARDTIWSVARNAVRESTQALVVRDAVQALVVRDLISEEHFRTLYGPWATVFGWPK